MESRSGRQRRLRWSLIFMLLGIGVCLLFALNLAIGTVRLSSSELFRAFSGEPTVHSRILWELRLPRALATLLLGGALALSGYLLQAFFRNPLAGPFVLGISSGAKLFVALLMITMFRTMTVISSSMMIVSAFAGALLSMGLVLLLSRKVRNMPMLVVSGVMVGYICSALTEFAITFAEDAEIVNLHNWSRGSFSGISWEQIGWMSLLIPICSILILGLAKPLSAYLLGDAYAQSMGVNVRRLRILLVIYSSILSAIIVAFAGPISFVGIAVPQLVLRIMGSGKPLLMIPACFLGGSFFCLFCDLLARNMFAPVELSISTVTAFFGAPVVIWIMMQKDR